ncbi:Stk1 family PASTA domain-containing Ser/Thr kinase [Oceanobacillus neutriphilus]|uniref:non-specific serine/threonine protein kinase n=1 Tax=Oceanobacillus neutriphilus TaxID=531815 RepID=A0ABQ2NWE2_9BACI|nr:Stk1 family PASTA domain-containing Ser/Thr kinase [Oceanobacillus neutriphilus]GGP12272.1 serine/threonine-protein kinase PrkC [Oceanobacillus neutriphilus]
MNKGHLLNDRYKIERKIGGGGMANVFLARDTILDRDVAVKALRTDYIHDQEFIARFDREAQSASSLSHPNIVNIYDVGEEDQTLYMVMEYVEGMTLKEYIQQFGPVEVPLALDIMKQISSAIAQAHENGIIHRDIKPQNILIDRFGQAKVTDFGIAMALSATALTQTNSILGSVHYLSPEQARGGMATKKSDVYSLGIVLFELLTGKLPFSGQSPVSIALKHLQSDTPSVKEINPDIPQSVENIVLQATAKNPFYRYADVYQFEAALETALSPEKLNEEPFKIPDEAGDETKAIPIITDDDLTSEDEAGQTIVHQAADTEPTKSYPDEGNGKKNNKKKKNKKPSSKKKKIIWISILLLLLIGIGTAAVVYAMQPKDVTIDDFINKPADEAKEALENKKLTVETEEVNSDEVESGYVERTDPVAGRTVKEGSTITLFVSQGPEQVEFDDYVGEDFEEVKEELDQKGFNVDEITPFERYSDQPVGEIISQVQPDPGASVVPADTKVIFEVSAGPEMVSLNNLTGMNEEEVKGYLDRNELSINQHEEHSDSVEKGLVSSQSPESGTEVEKGSTVDVYFSLGPEEEPPRSHSVTYTVMYTLDEENSESGEESSDDENSEEDQNDETNEENTDEENGDNENTDEGNEEETENQDSGEQIVRIYIGDANNDISDVYEEQTITGDTEVRFTLTIAQGTDAEYRITRDDEVVAERTVSYEGEEE